MEKLEKLLKDVSDLDRNYLKTKEGFLENFRELFFKELVSLFDGMCLISYNANSIFNITINFFDDKFKLHFGINFHDGDKIMVALDFRNYSNYSQVPQYPDNFFIYFDFNEFKDLISFSKNLINLLLEIYKNDDAIVSFSPAFFNVYFHDLDESKSMYKVVGEEDGEDVFDNDEFDNGYFDDDGSFCFDYLEGFDDLLKNILERYKDGFYKN